MENGVIYIIKKNKVDVHLGTKRLLDLIDRFIAHKVGSGAWPITVEARKKSRTPVFESFEVRI
jgi:hypothetical protein